MVAEHMSNSGIKPVSSEEINRIVTRSRFDEAVAAMDKANKQTSSEINNVSPVVASNDHFSPVINFPEHNRKSNETVKNDFSSFQNPKADSAETEQMIKDLKTLMDASKAGKENKNDNEDKTAEEAKKPEQKSVSANSAVDSEMRAWANRLSSKEDYLRQRENLANIKESENWKTRMDLDRREAELDAKEAEMKKGRVPANAPVVAAAAGRAGSDSASSELKMAKNKADADLSATPAGLTVTPERLEKLKAEDLKENKVNTEEPFVISVRLKSKLVHVRVAKFKNGNRTYLAPYLNDDNMEVKEAILKSPIFREFRYFLEQKETAYTPVKKIRK